MGRNLVKFKYFDGVVSNSKVWRHNRHFDVLTTEKVESLHCFFLKFLDGLSTNLVQGVILNFEFQILTQNRSIGSKS